MLLFLTLVNELFSPLSSWLTTPQASSSKGSHTPVALQFLYTKKSLLLGHVKLAMMPLGVSGQMYAVPDVCITSLPHMIPMNTVVQCNQTMVLQPLTY